MVRDRGLWSRGDFFADPDVIGFLDWSAGLMSGQTSLRHDWVSGASTFNCQTLYEAFLQYRWPNEPHGESFSGKVWWFDRLRLLIEEIRPIVDEDGRERFLCVARAVMLWGRMGRHLRNLNGWFPQEPGGGLEALLVRVREGLDPLREDRFLPRDLPGVNSSLSKIYSLLVPGLPIYDSRAACAIRCLVRVYLEDEPDRSSLLDFRVPPPDGSREGGRPPGRCSDPGTHNAPQVHARSNLRAAWLLQGMLESPGQFDQVDHAHQMDALQSALFMLGFTRIGHGAIGPAPAQ